MRNYKTTIPSKPRPYLAHEHPGFIDNCKSFVKRLGYLRNYRRLYKKAAKPLVFENLDLYLDREQGSNSPLHQHSCFLADYILDAWYNHYAQEDFGRAFYPGWPSEQGIASDSIEGVTRIQPFLAAYLKHYYALQALTVEERQAKGCDALLDTETAHKYQEALFKSFLSATDPNHKAYWGPLRSFSQTVCEAHDFALALWISKDFVFKKYSLKQQKQVINWLRDINSCETVDNNWHLFKVLVQAVLKDLESSLPENTFEKITEINVSLYERIKEFYLDEGWFRDGAKGDFDYYNSWGFHYSLFWLAEIAPELDLAWIKEVAQKFNSSFVYLFGAQGFALCGRSAPYRLGAASALISGDILNGQAQGEHVRALLSNNNNFFAKGALQGGMITQGLFKKDRRLIDPYSGPASSFWSLRPYILLFYKGLDVNYWSCIPKQLPVEKEDYEHHIPTIALRIVGIKESQEIIATFYHNQYKFDPQQSYLQDQCLFLKLKELVLGRSSRGKNNLLRKGVNTWTSQFNNYL